MEVTMDSTPVRTGRSKSPFDHQRELEVFQRQRVARLNAITDTWEFLRQLRATYAFGGGLIVRCHYARFISLVKTRPHAERDHLLYAAKFIFGVTLGSMRHDLKMLA
jgi:hypothetical protein